MSFLLLLALFSTPTALNSENLRVQFSVDSTWHLISGKVRDVSGKIWFDNPGDLKTSHVEVHLPVNSFDTDNSRRDARLREVMGAETYPEVIFIGGPLGSECDLNEDGADDVCNSKLPGNLQIRGVIKHLEIPIEIKRTGGNLSAHASTVVNWEEFGVEDPSILIAKLRKPVTITIDYIFTKNK